MIPLLSQRIRDAGGVSTNRGFWHVCGCGKAGCWSIFTCQVQLDTSNTKTVIQPQVLGTCRLRTQVPVKLNLTMSHTLEAFRRWQRRLPSHQKCLIRGVNDVVSKRTRELIFNDYAEAAFCRQCSACDAYHGDERSSDRRRCCVSGPLRRG